MNSLIDIRRALAGLLALATVAVPLAASAQAYRDRPPIYHHHHYHHHHRHVPYDHPPR